jgi:hypothetical protein
MIAYIHYTDDLPSTAFWVSVAGVVVWLLP